MPDWPTDYRLREQDRATAEAFAAPKPGDRFHEMYSWWVVVVSAGGDGVKVMCGSGPTNITRGRFPDGEIVEPFPGRAQVRWFATADDFRAAYSVKTMPGRYTVMLADRGKIDVTGWLERAKEVPAVPTHPAPPPEPRSDHVAVSRMALYGGTSHEVITVSRAFLVGAILDARSWCSEMETPGASMPTSGKVADYDAALAVLGAENDSAPAGAVREDGGS